MSKYFRPYIYSLLRRQRARRRRQQKEDWKMWTWASERTNDPHYVCKLITDYCFISCMLPSLSRLSWSSRIYEDTKINTKWIAKTCVKTRQITPCSMPCSIIGGSECNNKLLHFHFLVALLRDTLNNIECISTYMHVCAGDNRKIICNVSLSLSLSFKSW